MKRYKKYIITFFLILTFCISICFVPIDATRFIPIVQKQAEQEFGVQVHIEKLIFRFGPSLKIKAPVMHIMYEDGQKFGQMNNVKFYVPWSTLFKDNVYLKKIYADKCIIKINSNDKFLADLLEKIKIKEYEMYPNLQFKNYSISYNNKEKNKNYLFKGLNLEIGKVLNYKNLKINTDGEFYINEKPYIAYNLSFVPNVKADNKVKQTFDFYEIAEQIENLDFHSDIIADIKLYEKSDEEIQVSGLVNIDNISVLDPEKKNPKSFIYLTFLGNKIGILSNIYASSDKKIYAEGMVNNSKKPEIDLKVKTDNICISDIYKKIKLILDCSKYKGIDSIEGFLTADFNLKGDLHKIKSSGFMKISNAKIKAKGLNIKDINSEIDFSNNVVSISNAVGYVNNSPIMLKGKIDKTLDLQLLMNKVELKDLLPNDYGIQQGVISLDAVISGTLDNILHKENLQIEKFKAQKNKNLLSFDSLHINTNKDNIAYISNIVFRPQKTDFIKMPLLKLIIEGEKIKIPETNIFMPNSKLQLKAEILNYNNANCIFNSNIYGFINTKDLNLKESVVYPIKLNINGNKELQNIDSQVQITNVSLLDEPALINLSAKLNKNSLLIDDFSISPFNDTFSNNLKSNLKNPKKVIITGNIENFEEPIFKNIRIFIPQQLNITIKDVISQIKGDLFINGKLSQPEIVGQISASNIINQFMQLSMNNVTIDFNKNIAIINAPVVKLADSSAGINLTISTDFSKELFIKNINIKSKYLNTDTILMYKDSPLTTLLPLKIVDGKIYAERLKAAMYGSHLSMSGYNSELKLNDNILNLKNISSDIYNGKLAGNIDYNLKKDSFTCNIQARGVSASPIFDVITTKKDSISGVMDFDSILSGNILSKQSLNGSVRFIIHNGHMGTLGKLEHLIYAQNVVADNMLRTSLSLVTKAITLKDTGLFKYLRGDLTLKNGIADIHMLQSQGPLMSLYIKGQYNPMIDYAKLVVLGRISDELTDCLGAFGEFSLNKLMIMLTGDDNKLNIKVDDIEKLPQLPMRNTKEFRSVINGILEKPSSVIQFNWISYSQKSLRQKDVTNYNEKIPDFIETLPY